MIGKNDKGRDIAILKIVKRRRFASTQQIWDLLPTDVRGTDYNTFQDRLLKFARFHYIRRVGKMWPGVMAKYEITDKGNACLEERAEKEFYSDTVTPTNKRLPRKEFAHTKMIVDVLASIEKGVNADPNVKFISWEEILQRAPEKTRTLDNPHLFPKVHISLQHTTGKMKGKTEHMDISLLPDAFFGLEYQTPEGKQYRFFALETEHKDNLTRSTLKKNSFLRKALAYRALMSRRNSEPKYRLHLGIPNMYVIFAAPTLGRAKRMQEIAGESAYFLYAAMPVENYDYLTEPPSMPDFYNDPYQRSGKPSFFINKPDKQ